MSFKDPSQNYISRHPRVLDAIFKPKTVAVIGAKDDLGSVGRTILSNLMATPFPGIVFPVNPKRDEVLGLKCYPNLDAIGEKIDLAIIVTPANTVPKIMKECAEAGVKSCIIISAGFKELGDAGLALEKEVIKIAKEAEIPVIGPNCLGIMNPIYGLNATFARGMALKGNLAFISQSGAMCTSVLDWSFKENLGFSSFVSIGSMADIDFGDLIDYLGGDEETHSILIYMETIGNPRKFLSAAREIAIEKPIIVIKAGRSFQAAKAAASHTGSLAGSDEVFDAALERVGILRVNTIAELFQMASVLSRQPRPKGPKLSIVTNAGGPGVLATDATILNGAELTTLQNTTIEALNHVLPAAWSHSNPIDILGDAGPDRFAKTIEILSKDKESDGILAILSPQDMTDPSTTAEILRRYAKIPDKPLLASWMGGTSVLKGIEILNRAHVPTFEYPDDAAATFGMMWKYSKNIQSLYEVPLREYLQIFLDKEKSSQRKEAKEIILTATKNGETLLDEFQSKKFLEGYDIPIVKTEIAVTEDEAVEVAKRIGFPCVLKLYSKTITHKSDVGGVKLNLKTVDEVKRAYQDIFESVKSKVGEQHFQGVTVQQMIAREGYELILGSIVDPQFGPTILFGLGGQLVEVFKDSALGLPPLNQKLAEDLMKKTKIYEALQGVRGKKAVPLDKLAELLVKFSQMIIENPRIKECDINPLLASSDGCIALDARIVLYEANVPNRELPKPAIRPYPYQYVSEKTLKNGAHVIIRPITPEDEPLIVSFHHELSENSVRQRYFEFVSLDKRVAHERLMRICFNDFDREIALVAETTDPDKAIVGIIRISRISSSQDGQLTMIIVDAYHHLGLGTELLNQAIEIAKKEKLKDIYAHILDENSGMISLCKRVGFKVSPSEEKSILKADLKL